MEPRLNSVQTLLPAFKLCGRTGPPQS